MRRLLFLFAATLAAQDAELVLRTSVSYNTMRASLPLTEAKKEEAATLGQQAQQASREGKYGDAMRHMHRGIAVMQGFSWTPAVEFAASLQASVDDAIADRGQALQLTLKPLYATAEPVTAKVRLSFRSTAPGVAPIALGEEVEVKSAEVSDPTWCCDHGGELGEF